MESFGLLAVSEPEFTEHTAVPGTGAKDAAMNKTSRVPVFRDFMFWVEMGVRWTLYLYHPPHCIQCVLSQC